MTRSCSSCLDRTCRIHSILNNNIDMFDNGMVILIYIYIYTILLRFSREAPYYVALLQNYFTHIARTRFIFTKAGIIVSNTVVLNLYFLRGPFLVFIFLKKISTNKYSISHTKYTLFTQGPSNVLGLFNIFSGLLVVLKVHVEN